MKMLLTTKRLKAFASIMATLAIMLSAGSAFSADTNVVEDWNSGTIAGWKGTNGLVIGPIVVSNPSNHLHIAFGDQTASMSFPEIYIPYADPSAANGNFTGDYLAANVAIVRFRMYCATHVPSQAWLTFRAGTSGREWYYSLTELQAGQWVEFEVPMYTTNNWSTGSTPTEEKFREDLANVDRIGIMIIRNGTSQPQEYGIDDFTMIGAPPFASISGQIYNPDGQFGIIWVTAATNAAGTGTIQRRPVIGNGSPYTFGSLPTLTDYWITAFLDINGSGTHESYEASGSWIGNPVLNLMGDTTGIDIILSEPTTEDGLPYWWLMANFGITNATGLYLGADDPDDDGMNNWAEYRAGTDPNDYLSIFFAEIYPDDMSPSGTILTWYSIPNRTYAVWRTIRMSESFTRIQQGIPATPPVNEFTDPNATAADTYFYKIEVEND